MNIEFPTLPAREAAEYPLYRILRLNAVQNELGGLMRIDATLRFYSETLGDAPATYDKSISFTLSLPQLMAIEGMAQSFGVITGAIVAEGVRAGVLTAIASSLQSQVANIVQSIASEDGQAGVLVER